MTEPVATACNRWGGVLVERVVLARAGVDPGDGGVGAAGRDVAVDVGAAGGLQVERAARVGLDVRVAGAVGVVRDAGFRGRGLEGGEAGIVGDGAGTEVPVPFRYRGEGGLVGAGAVERLPELVPFTPQFRADRPFVYLIRDRASGAILFLGAMQNPSQT